MINYSCGHKNDWCPGSDIHTPSLCYDCRQALVGTTIHFVRFGAIPNGGQSYNYRDNRNEDGVSCYMIISGIIKNTIRCEFGDRTKIIYGTATLVGFGGDDEPLIDADTITIKRLPKKIKEVIKTAAYKE